MRDHRPPASPASSRPIARRKAGPVRRQFASGRLTLSYVDWGNAGAPLLVLLHGSRDHCRSWDWTARMLRDDWHVVAPDLRGHGDSMWSPDGRYDFAAYICDLAAFFGAVAEGPATFVGHSLGGHIALRFAGVYPERVSRLVAIEAVGAPPEIEATRGNVPAHERIRRWIAERDAAAAYAARRFDTIDEAVTRMRAIHPRLDEERARHLAHHGLCRHQGGGWRWKHDPFLSVWPFPDITQEEILSLWRRIACPTMLVYGKQSWPSDVPEALRGSIAHAHMLTLDQAGHWPQHDRFDAFMECLRPFLDEMREG